MTNRDSLQKTLLYIDFEANKAGELFLFGFDRGEGYEVWVLNEELRGWAQAKGYHFAEETEVLDLIKKYSIVVAYSQAERFILENMAERSGHHFSSSVCYLDARKLAVTWAGRCRKAIFDQLPALGKTLAEKNRPKKKSLISMARLVGKDGWNSYGFGLVMKRIKQVRDGLLAKRGDFNKLTAHQKRQATKVITHNRFDIEAMQLLVETAIDELPWLMERYLLTLGGYER